LYIRCLGTCPREMNEAKNGGHVFLYWFCLLYPRGTVPGHDLRSSFGLDICLVASSGVLSCLHEAGAPVGVAKTGWDTLHTFASINTVVTRIIFIAAIFTTAALAVFRCALIASLLHFTGKTHTRKHEHEASRNGCAARKVLIVFIYGMRRLARRWAAAPYASATLSLVSACATRGIDAIALSLCAVFSLGSRTLIERLPCSEKSRVVLWACLCQTRADRCLCRPRAGGHVPFWLPAPRCDRHCGAVATLDGAAATCTVYVAGPGAFGRRHACLRLASGIIPISIAMADDHRSVCRPLSSNRLSWCWSAALRRWLFCLS
jgi:hypothetical protein